MIAVVAAGRVALITDLMIARGVIDVVPGSGGVTDDVPSFSVVIWLAEMVRFRCTSADVQNGTFIALDFYFFLELF